MFNKSGIYKIVSICQPAKIYVGSAVNISDRWNRHLSDLRNKHHANRHLQRHFCKHGETDLIFEIIEFCEPGQLLTREQFYIDTLKPQFNICADAGSRFGVVATFATREKIKKIWKSRTPISMASRLKKNKT